MTDASYVWDWMEAIREYYRGNPAVLRTVATTYTRTDTTVVTSPSIIQTWSYGGVNWKQLTYVNSSNEIVSVTAVTTF